MIFTALHEGFFTQIKVGLFTALCISFPIFSIQIWKFKRQHSIRMRKQHFCHFSLLHQSCFAGCCDGVLHCDTARFVFRWL